MNKPIDVNIAFIGGGSRGWAFSLMSDLAKEEEIRCHIRLYDIDKKASEMNAKIGNDLSARDDIVGKHEWRATHTYKEALTGADFVVISVMPGTFKEMHSDVHTPEKYGIYQPVGDSSGPGGIIRALRTIPMFREFAREIKKYCPKAWVINYTNPMTLCTRTLYEEFPEIKAFGCCHEVFETKELMGLALKRETGIEIARDDISFSVSGVNHFTWITEAHYKNYDLMEMYKRFAEEYKDVGFIHKNDHWMNNFFADAKRIKFDLFLRYGAAAAAGDRHLSEFCPGSWYLKDKEKVREWMFGLTTVDWRMENLEERLKNQRELYEGKKFEVFETGEEGVKQIKSIMGLSTLVTNVNLPNRGQAPDLPMGAVVETNAVFNDDMVTPVATNPLPGGACDLVKRIIAEQELVIKACFSGDYEEAYKAFCMDPLMRLDLTDCRKLWIEMIENTVDYIPGGQEYLAKIR